MGVLGEGQHATVYRAYDPILERDVALKVPRQGVLKTAKAVMRFLGEAKALARLRHPRIVPVYEAGCAGHRHFIAMALIEGRSLAERLAQGPLALRRATEIVAELAEALAYAHAQGVVHRDVKPANIRVDDQGAVYLMDFGIAYHPDSGEVPLPPGMILGTPAYVAPEQAQGGQPNVLPASDQYSLGVVLYELLCGQPPFCGPPSYVLFHAIHLDPPSPHTVAPGISRSLAAICLKALAKGPRPSVRRLPGIRRRPAALAPWRDPLGLPSHLGTTAGMILAFRPGLCVELLVLGTRNYPPTGWSSAAPTSISTSATSGRSGFPPARRSPRRAWERSDRPSPRARYGTLPERSGGSPRGPRSLFPRYSLDRPRRAYRCTAWSTDICRHRGCTGRGSEMGRSCRGPRRS